MARHPRVRWPHLQSASSAQSCGGNTEEPSYPSEIVDHWTHDVDSSATTLPAATRSRWTQGFLTPGGLRNTPSRARAAGHHLRLRRALPKLGARLTHIKAALQRFLA